MAETTKTYVSDGTTTIYTFDFDYISKAFVKVLVNGVEVGRTLSGTYQVTLNAAPQVGDVILITRKTDTDRLVDFVDGSVLVAKDLNLSALQATHIAAEALDAASGSLLIDETGAFSAGGRRITQVGDPTGDDDVVSRGWINAQGAGFIQQSQAAQTAAEAAQAASEGARDTALTHRNAAQTARTGAETAQAASEGARDTALAHANTAETHKDAAQVARTGAEAALASTQAIESAIGDLRADGAVAVAAAQAEAARAETEADASAASAAAAAQSAIDAAAAAGFDPADFAAASHGHAISEITGLQATLDVKITKAQADGWYAAVGHGHAIADITGLQTALNGKAASSHTHSIANVTGLQSALDGKAASSHTHDASDITAGTLALARVPVANQSQAEAGTSGSVLMTAQRVGQFWDKHVTISISDPSGGDDGDLWFKVE